ncbi:hypothetical protein C6499_19830 [Candidatus Poribacteria bacterium]|nr:MAG: hypothetical protein C6499_19830 [Candidatus Poribacteria bacterium]
MTVNLAIAQLLLSACLVSITFIWGIFRYRRGDYRRRDRYSRLQAYLLWAVGGLIGLSTFYPLAWLYTEHLLHESLGRTDVFWGLHKIRWGFFLFCFIVAAGFMNINAAIANVLCPEPREFRRWTHTRTFSFHRTVVFITVVLGLLMAIPMLLMDDIVLRYLNQPGAEAVPAGEDALHFGKDRNFYLFSYPMHKWVSLWVQILLWVTCIVVGLLYNFYYRRDAHTMARVKRHIIFHGTALWMLLLIVSGWRSYVDLWDRVYKTPLTYEISSLHGLFYVDFYRAGATQVYCGVLIGIAIVIVLNILWRRRLLWYVTAGVWGLSYILLLHVYPIGVYLWDARIDIIVKEEPYLTQHIKDTQHAFELDTIKTVTYEQREEPATLEVITENEAVKKSIQIWDRRVFYEALREKQIVTHYDFHAYTDVDRYRVNDEYRQVLIAAREVAPEDITGWEQLKLEYTHGYGVCMSPVNVFVEDGYPDFWVSEVPIKGNHGFNVTQPQIYYGEMTHDYVIVKAERKENGTQVPFEPPEDTENSDVDVNAEKIAAALEHTYVGDGGIPLGGWFRRLCFALRFDFFRVLRSDRITPESRIMFHRKIGTRRGDRLVWDRVSRIAPFLNYDPDPYVVINDGQLYWIIDFYVTSQYYPNSQMYVDDTARLTGELELYEEPDFDKFNYIRNAGVAVVNAYTGAVAFYAVKDGEEVMQTYQQAFPDLFKTVSEMPEGLSAHLRYPDYLTRIQAKMYGNYHQDAGDFYKRQNLWKIPKEAYYSSTADQEMMPYYTMLKLPGEAQAEFVNMIPLTPPKREKRLKAWMVARCDQPHYGERIVYILTTDVPGPTQVEADINKAISGDLLRWKEANDVIRGNLLIIPIEDTLFYIEAIYLQEKKPTPKKGEKAIEPDTPRRPKLEMVIVKAGSSELGTAKTFDEALDVLFLGGPVNGEQPAANGEKPMTIEELFKEMDRIDAASAAEKKQLRERIRKLLEKQGDR